MYNGLSIENADFMRVAIAPAYEINENEIQELKIVKKRIRFVPFGDSSVVPNDCQKIAFSCATGKKTVIEYGNGDTWVQDIDLSQLDVDSKYLYYYYLCVHKMNKFAFALSIWQCDCSPLFHRWEDSNNPPSYVQDWDHPHDFDESQIMLLNIQTIVNPRQQIWIADIPELGLWNNFSADLAVVRTVEEKKRLLNRLNICLKAARRYMAKEMLPRD